MDKQAAASKISLFLKMWFTTMGALEVGFAITKDNKIMIIDSETGLSKTFTSKELEETYNEWAKENL